MEKTYHSHDGLFDCFDIILKKPMGTKFSWILLNHEHFSKASWILSGKLSIFINFLKPGSTRSV